MITSQGASQGGRILQADDKNRNIQATVFAGLAGLREIREAWEDIFLRLEAPAYHHLYQWQESWLAWLAPAPDQAIYVLFETDGQPLAILPLVYEQRSFCGVRLACWRLPWCEHSLTADLLAVNEALELPLLGLLPGLLSKLDRPWDGLFLGPTPENGLTARLFASARLPRSLIEPAGWGSRLDVAHGRDAWLAGFSSSFLKKMRYSKKLLSRSGDVSYRFGNTERLHAAFEEFMRVEASGWKGEAGTRSAIRLDPRLTGFYSSLVDIKGAAGCEIHTLELDGACLAAQFCLRAGKTISVPKIGYEESKARLSPGRLLRFAFIEECFQRPDIDAIDFVTCSDWLTDLGFARLPLVAACHFRGSALGRLAYALLRVKSTLRPFWLGLARRRTKDNAA